MGHMGHGSSVRWGLSDPLSALISTIHIVYIHKCIAAIGIVDIHNANSGSIFTNELLISTIATAISIISILDKCTISTMKLRISAMWI
jgi:hypothetical protein